MPTVSCVSSSGLKDSRLASVPTTASHWQAKSFASWVDSGRNNSTSARSVSPRNSGWETERATLDSSSRSSAIESPAR